MTTTLPNGAGYMDYEDVNVDDHVCDIYCAGRNGTCLLDEGMYPDEEDFTGASDELGYANDR